MTDQKKQEVIDKVTQILKETPSSVDAVKKDSKQDQRFRYLANHMVEKAIKKDALVLSENGEGIAILFRTNSQDSSIWKDLWQQIGLVLNVTGVRKALKILKTQKYIKDQRPKEGDYLYCWFWGITKNFRGAETQVGREMKDEFFRIAHEQGLSLYAETRGRTNSIVYQRVGFDLFHTWEDHPSGETMYFLKYDPKKNESNT